MKPHYHRLTLPLMMLEALLNAQWSMVNSQLHNRILRLQLYKG